MLTKMNLISTSFSGQFPPVLLLNFKSDKSDVKVFALPVIAEN